MARVDANLKNVVNILGPGEEGELDDHEEGKAAVVALIVVGCPFPNNQSAEANSFPRSPP
jgi:hypothetical protein